MKSLVTTWLLTAMAVVGFAIPASASSGENSGQINSIFAYATSGSMDFQVTIVGLGTLCPSHNIAYVNTTDANYKEIVAEILKVRSLEPTYGYPLYIYWTTDASGYCHITHVYF